MTARDRLTDFKLGKASQLKRKMTGSASGGLAMYRNRHIFFSFYDRLFQ